MDYQESKIVRYILDANDNFLNENSHRIGELPLSYRNNIPGFILVHSEQDDRLIAG